ncbi:MAG: MFS transporter [Actinomycetota bacterium]|nr:MFS transporter [Actinomycetota bacterium]
MSSTQPKQRKDPRSLWHQDFRRLWGAETVSQLGTQVTILALPLTAVLILNATPFEVGLLGTAEFLPFLLIGLPAGVWVDRLRRRPILILGDLGRAFALGSVPLAYELGVLHIGQLYAVAFVSGICTVFFDVAYQSYLPSLVDRDQLVEGNSKLEISRSGAQLAGPGLAGGLIQLLKAPVAILVDAISYLGSAAFVFTIRKKEAPVLKHEPDGEPHPSMKEQIGEGLRYVFRHPLLRPIAFCTATSNFFGPMAMAILILFAVRVLGLTPGAIGIIFAIGNAGFFLGAFVSGKLAKRFGVGPTIIGSSILFSFSGLLLPLATPSSAWIVIIGSELVGGFGGVVYNINQVSLRQAITSERMQGRMNATIRFVIWGTIPIGSFLGGVLGGTIGLRPTLWVAGIGGIFAFVPPLFSPVRRLRTIPEPPPEGEADVAPSTILGRAVTEDPVSD